MSYTALYRKFRPQGFSELVGQEHISCTLLNAVAKGNIVHAYLFCGPRGTGKTSVAKILAKAVNCLNPATNGDPCNCCEACKRINAAESMDIMEIDAASNRGIDEIRDLRERVKYAPAQEKFKVYIIDEVHMLTTEAFNALLKTLEEPPKHIIFILATTEAHKIPLTVLSRCQRFDFRRISDEKIIGRLKEVCSKEAIVYEDVALDLIARKAQGGLRDALGLLDQCAGFSDNQITESAVYQVLGSVDGDFVAQLAHDLILGDLKAVLTSVAELASSGIDLRQFLQDLVEYLRCLFLWKLQADVPLSFSKTMEGWGNQVEEQRILGVLQALGDGDNRMKYSLQPRISLELILLAACGYKGETPFLPVEVIPEVKQQHVVQKKTSVLPPVPQPSGKKLVAHSAGAEEPDLSELDLPVNLPSWEELTAAKAVAPQILGDAKNLPWDDEPPFVEEMPEEAMLPDDLPPWEQLSAKKPAAALSVKNKSEKPKSVSKNTVPTVSLAGNSLSDANSPPWGEEISQQFAANESRVSTSNAKSVNEKAVTPVAKVVAPVPKAVANGKELTVIADHWGAILLAVKKENVSANAFLREGKPYDFANDKLTLAYSPRHKIHMETILNKQIYRHIVEKEISVLMGKSITIAGVLIEPADNGEAPSLDNMGNIFS